MHRFDPQNIQILDLGPDCDVFYHPTWLSFAVARQLFASLHAKIPFKQHRVGIAGTLIDQPRLTCWFGDSSYTYSGLTIQPDPWIPELLSLRQKLVTDLNINFNSVLANLYQDGSNHISWHADSEKQIGPTIASVSLGGLREFDIRNPQLNKHYSLELQTGSLVVMGSETQKHCQHRIVKTNRIVEPRINLTFRVLQ